MDLSRGHIDTRTDSKGLLLACAVFRVIDLQTSAADQMRRQARVRMWWVVGVSVRDMFELAEGNNAGSDGDPGRAKSRGKEGNI
jgi:hypothetical protein